ncbi:MAG: hypothetical protein QOK39_340 [Acidimicrobiaceae bacterium]|nr:hypothetical protein [Acidimicrobiaceae bacterium]
MRNPGIEWAEAPLAGTGITPIRALELAQGAAPTTAGEAGVTAALAAGWAIAAGADPVGVDAKEGSVELYDLGMRLRAATTGQLQARLAQRVTPGDWPLVAVAVSGRDTATVITVARPGQSAVTAGADAALAALAPAVPDNPNGADDGHECLVVENRGQLRRLATIAAAACHANADSRHNNAAARLAWWLQRAEHPGGAAVIEVATACAQRWVTGTDPTTTTLATWTTWLELRPGAAAAVLLGAADALRQGPMLATLATKVKTQDDGTVRTEGREDEDLRSWTAFLDARRRATPWWGRDSPKAAALGLQSRSDAAEYWSRALLDDPRWAVRARFDGHVVVATVEAIQGRNVRLVARQSACRYRPGTKLALRRGADSDVSAEMVAATMTDRGQLAINLDCHQAASKLTVGQRVEMVPKALSLSQMARGRKNLADRYLHRSWARDGGIHDLVRRDVPLDVLVAAAEPAPPTTTTGDHS